jgi:hypothetical protein
MHSYTGIHLEQTFHFMGMNGIWSTSVHRKFKDVYAGILDLEIIFRGYYSFVKMGMLMQVFHYTPMEIHKFNIVKV